jgi:hypothetical protein
VPGFASLFAGGVGGAAPPAASGVCSGGGAAAAPPHDSSRPGGKADHLNPDQYVLTASHTNRV